MSSIGSSAIFDPRHVSLIQASAGGNDAKVRALVSEAAWHSQMDKDALRQSLQRVSARGNRNLSLAKFLIEKGADVNPRRENEPSALFKAAEGGHEKMVRLLLEHSPDTEARDRDGRTALFKPVLRGSIETVAALLDGGADVNARDKEKRTALIHLAAEKLGRWKLDMIQLLLSKKADVEAKDDTRRTALLWAAATGKTEVVQLLLSGEFATAADVSASNNRGRTALHLACENGHEAVVSLLLVHGADPGAESDGGWTPLHHAAEKGHLEIMKLLLDTEANVNAKLSNGMTPLHWASISSSFLYGEINTKQAAFNGHLEVVRALLTRPEANLAFKDTFDRTPMLCAAEKYHGDIVELLSPSMTGDRLPPLRRQACEAFEATVVDFGDLGTRQHKEQMRSGYSVYDLLYGWNAEDDKPKVSTNIKSMKRQLRFRWIHLPANNVHSVFSHDRFHSADIVIDQLDSTLR